MTSPPPPGPMPAADALALEQRLIAEAAIADVVSETTAWLAAGGFASEAVSDDQWQVNRLASLNALRQRLASQAGKARALQQQTIPGVVQEAAKRASGLGRVPVGTQQVVDDLSAALDRMWAQVPGLLTRFGQQIVTEATAQVRAGNLNRVQATTRAVDRLLQTGIAPARDAAGRRWTAPAYVEMRARTGILDAGRLGREDAAREYGTAYVQVSDAIRECPLCLIPGTIVEGPVPTGRTASEYSGDVVRIVTASGKDLTGTPDHPVLTPQGWVSLKNLRPGDKVISNVGQQGIAGVVPDHVDVPTRIEEVGKATVPLLLASPARRELDGHVSHREVRAVIPDGHLLTERDLAFLKPISDLLLVSGVGATSPFLGMDDGADYFGRSGHSTGGLMCGVEHGGSLLLGGELPAQAHGLGTLLLEDARINGVESALQSVMTWAGLDTSSPQVVTDHPTADAEGGAELLRSLSGYVAADEIVSVGRRQFRGHVWDLSTEPAWFLANGIVTHNCRPWEGKILSLDGNDPEGIAAGSIAEARAAGLYHPNCRHSHAAYFPGLSLRAKPTQDPDGYKASQEQRALERELRAAKLRAQAAERLDPGGDVHRRAQGRVKALQARLRAHTAQSGQRRRYDREQVPAA